MRFNILDCWYVDQYLLVIQDGERVRIDLPDPGEERNALVQQALLRSDHVSSPEVIRFRPGRFSFAQLANEEPFCAMESHLANEATAKAAKQDRRRIKRRFR